MLNRFSARLAKETLAGENTATENATPQPSMGLWLDRGILVAVVLGAVVGISPNFVDPDLWGHVQYGRDVLNHGLPATTTYSYIAAGYPWINHEILAELSLAVCCDDEHQACRKVFPRSSMHSALQREPMPSRSALCDGDDGAYSTSADRTRRALRKY